MARIKKTTHPDPENKFVKQEAPPPPLFTGEKEKDLVKQVNDELLERVIGQQIVYFPIDRERTKYNEVYGEATQKTFLSPISVYVMLDWGETKTVNGTFGLDRTTQLNARFHNRRLTEDQDLYVREGDFIRFDDETYEIVSITIPKLLFGDAYKLFEVDATCVKTRANIFTPK